MKAKHTKAVSRRDFLRRSVVLGLAGLAQRALGGLTSPARAADTGGPPEPPGPSAAPDAAPAQDLDHHVYLPYIASQQETLAHGPSKLGLHTLRANNAVAFVQSVHDAGARVALVKALDVFGYLRQVKQISPETVTVARWNGIWSVDPVGDPAQRAAEIMAEHMTRWQYERDVVDYWEVLNEVSPPPPVMEGHVWLARFFIEAMKIADANDYKLALFSYSVGVPRWHDWEAIVETEVFAEARERGHVLALHEYNWPVMSNLWGEPTEDLPPYEDRGVLTGRYRYLYRDFLIPRDEVIPLLITETGLDPVLWQPGQPETWKERYVEEMAWYDTKIREDDYVVGATMFTLGGFDQWADYDYEELLWPGNPYGANFLDYIVSLKDA